MTPDEFEQYLGLDGDTDAMAYQSERPKDTAIDQMLANRYQGDIEESYSQQPVISAAAGDGASDGGDLVGTNCAPSSMFDSFD